MSKLELDLPEGPNRARGKVVAKIRGRSPDGKKRTSRTVVLELGKPNTIDVDPGHVSLQVQLPSGEIISQQAVVEDPDETRKLDIQQRPSRREWLGWQQTMSPDAQYAAGAEPPTGDEPPSFSTGASFVEAARVYIDGKPHDISKTTTIDGVTFTVNHDEKTFSVTVEKFRHGLVMVELEHGGEREIARAPLPWFDDHYNPLPVQLIFELCDEGVRPDVIVHDPELSPILAYFSSGNLLAARQLSENLQERAYNAIMGKFQNPIAAVAGAIVLRQIKRVSPQQRGDAALPQAWLDNLGNIKSIPDGAILAGTQRLEQKNHAAARELFLSAFKRGVPVFARAGRMLLEGLQRLRYSMPTDVDLQNAFTWARSLVDTQREDTMITWLSSDDETLARIVDLTSTGAPPAAASGSGGSGSGPTGPGQSGVVQSGPSGPGVVPSGPTGPGQSDWQQSPMQQSPMQQSPQQSPMQQSPQQQSPMQQSPMQQSPMQQSPQQQSPQQQSPQQQLPTKQSTIQAPTKQSPTQQTPRSTSPRPTRASTATTGAKKPSTSTRKSPAKARATRPVVKKSKPAKKSKRR